MTKLSICIPTYNFGKFIGQTLQSIVPQLNQQTELLIIDGNSQDETEAVVKTFQERAPSIRYMKLGQRGGIDRDMAIAIQEARGDYCWLFSADDIMKEGVIGELLERIGSNADLYLCGFTNCTFHLNPREEFTITRALDRSSYQLKDPKERLSYFEKALKTPAFFSFMGSIILKRDRWIQTPIEDRFFGTLWAHVARIFSMIPQGLCVEIIARSYLYKRADNDSFLDQGVIHRLDIAVRGFHALAHEFFGENSKEASYIRAAVRKERSYRSLFHVKSQVFKRSDHQKLNQIVSVHYADPGCRLHYWLYRLMPAALCRLLVFVYRRYKAPKPSL